MTPADEFLRPLNVAGDNGLPLRACSVRPVDILSDLGMTEDMIAAYFRRWRWGWAHIQALGLLRSPGTLSRREDPLASSIILP